MKIQILTRFMNSNHDSVSIIIVIIINKVLIKVTLNRVIAGALFTVSG